MDHRRVSTRPPQPEVTEGMLHYLENIFPTTAYTTVVSLQEMYELHGVERVKAHFRALHATQNKR